jgi:type IV secretory pathway component VirB8
VKDNVKTAKYFNISVVVFVIIVVVIVIIIIIIIGKSALYEPHLSSEDSDGFVLN